jgi:TolA-binding protein
MLSGCAVFDQPVGKAAQEEKKQIEKSSQEEKKPIESEEELRAKAAIRHLATAKRLLEQGDPDSSIKESLKALNLAGKNSPGDEALFNIGIAHIHPKNTKKDYDRSIAVFSRMIKEYPQSQLIEQARTWIDLLRVIEKLKKVDIVIEEKKKELSK